MGDVRHILGLGEKSASGVSEGFRHDPAVWPAFPWVPQPMEVSLLSFPSCRISRTEHTLPLELSCSRSSTFNTNQLKLTGRFHCCISDLAGKGPELERQGCHVLSHCSDTVEGRESPESRGCRALLCADDLSMLHPAPPTTAFQQCQLQNPSNWECSCLVISARPWLYYCPPGKSDLAPYLHKLQPLKHKENQVHFPLPCTLFRGLSEVLDFPFPCVPPLRVHVYLRFKFMSSFLSLSIHSSDLVCSLSFCIQLV